MKSYQELTREAIAEGEAEIAAEQQAKERQATELRERLAEYSHTAWAGWMKYQFSKGKMMTVRINGETQQCWVMPQASLERWQRQSETPYSQLPESEKASDRDEADKILAIVA